MSNTGKLGLELVSSRIDHENDRFKVRCDAVRYPDGRVRDFYLLEGPPFVVLVVRRADRIGLVRQYRHAVGEVTVEFPKGSVEPGETPEAAAVRELHEETGCAATQQDLIRLATLPASLSSVRRTAHVFLVCDPLDAEQPCKKDPTEWDLDAEWALLTEFRADV